MKKLLLCLLILNMSIQIKSDNYTAFLKEGNKWNYLAIAYTTCCGSMTKTYSLFLSGDTLIENVQYKKMMCEHITEDMRRVTYAGAIRENIAEQSIYFRAANDVEKEVFSFNYQVGDTVSVDTISPLVKKIMFAKSVDNYQFGSYSGKKIVVSDTTYYANTGQKYSGHSYTWYEGIGSYNLSYQFSNDFHEFPFVEEQSELLCFWNNDTKIYENEKYGFCENAESRSGIENVNKPKLLVSPNPAKNILNVSTESEMKTIKIFDVLANLVLETNQKTIDISNLPNGIFIVKILLPSNEMIEQKIIKCADN